MTYVQQTKQAAEYINRKINQPGFRPQVALTLGSGLNKLAKVIKPLAIIPYSKIPYFSKTTVVGHEGKLIIGQLEGVNVVGFQGRKHFYEVANAKNAMDQVVFPVHVAANLGCQLYLATNAAGGLNPNFQVGDLMIIKSHISFFLPNPLLGPHHNFANNDYFQPLHQIYSEKLRNQFKKIDANIKQGIYCALTGRTFETQAESLMLRKLGVDAVGMSTVPEIIVAVNRGMDTLGVSLITNVIAKDGTNATSHDEVMSVLNSPKLEEKLTKIFTKFFSNLPQLI